MTRIYLDNAATSWPKPPAVYDAIEYYLRHEGAPAGRGSYSVAETVSRKIEQTRSQLAQFLAVDDPRQVVWTYSGTDSLHLALNGILRKGDHVVTSAVEHNSILRPLNQFEAEGMIRVTRVDCDPSGVLSPDAVADALEHETRLVALSHASNVTGQVQPLTQIGKALEDHPALFLVDAAQTVGHCPVSVKSLRCDLLAAPGHKGLLGPTGTGFLYIKPTLNDAMRPVRLGGTGSSSESDIQPNTMPDRFEAGNLNVVGIVGIAAGLEFIRERGLVNLQQHEQELARQLKQQLATLSGVTVFGVDTSNEAADSGTADDQLGVVSFNVDGFDPQEVAVLLDQIATIQVRAGFHCSPRMHQALQTDKMGGTVRASFGPFNDATHVELLVATLRQISGG